MTDKPARSPRPQQVYTLLVEVGRRAGDGLALFQNALRYAATI